jgi:hypothetical protein
LPNVLCDGLDTYGTELHASRQHFGVAHGSIALRSFRLIQPPR